MTLDEIKATLNTNLNNDFATPEGIQRQYDACLAKAKNHSNSFEIFSLRWKDNSRTALTIERHAFDNKGNPK